MYSKSKVTISQADYKELNGDYGKSRWTCEEYAYWAAKFNTGFPAEGYGLYGAHVEEENGKYYIVWEHMNSCD